MGGIVQNFKIFRFYVSLLGAVFALSQFYEPQKIWTHRLNSPHNWATTLSASQLAKILKIVIHILEFKFLLSWSGELRIGCFNWPSLL